MASVAAEGARWPGYPGPQGRVGARRARRACRRTCGPWRCGPRSGRGWCCGTWRAGSAAGSLPAAATSGGSTQTPLTGSSSVPSAAVDGQDLSTFDRTDRSGLGDVAALDGQGDLPIHQRVGWARRRGTARWPRPSAGRRRPRGPPARRRGRTRRRGNCPAWSVPARPASANAGRRRPAPCRGKFAGIHRAAP